MTTKDNVIIQQISVQTALQLLAKAKHEKPDVSENELLVGLFADMTKSMTAITLFLGKLDLSKKYDAWLQGDADVII